MVNPGRSLRLTVALGLAGVAFAGAAYAGSARTAPDSDLRARVERFLAGHRVQIAEQFAALLAIPSTAADPAGLERMATAVAEALAERGLQVSLLREPGAPPLVSAERLVAGARSTLLLYAHYDGQPVRPERWTTGPWRAVLRDGRLEAGARERALSALADGPAPDWRMYARSAADDKVTIAAMLGALDLLEQERIPLSVNLKVLIEGEEEAGSPHLAEALRRNRERLAADALFICDGPVHQSGEKQVLLGARGTLGLEVTVYGPDHPLHSGHYGNWAPNPVALLAVLLASMRDAEGTILIPGFLDDVRPTTDGERASLASLPDPDARLREEYALAWSEAGGARLVERVMLPAVNFRGVLGGNVGAQATNAIPAEASASIDFRLVPDQRPERIKEVVEAHVARQGFHVVHETPGLATRRTTPRLVRLVWEEGYPPYRLDAGHPLGRATAEVLGEALDREPLVVPTVGGSVPMHLFAEALGVPVLVLPIANHDNNQHGPDENVRLGNLWDGIAMYAALLSRLGARL